LAHDRKEVTKVYISQFVSDASVTTSRRPDDLRGRQPLEGAERSDVTRRVRMVERVRRLFGGSTPRHISSVEGHA
jgi:hypothetical protein